MMPKALCLFCWLCLAACSTAPKPVSVQLGPRQSLALPAPAELGYALQASQLLLARWQDQHTQIPVQLEVADGELRLAGFTTWGARLFSLSYNGEQIQVDKLPLTGQALPEPTQVLFNLMLTLWPEAAWQEPLAALGWRLEQQGLRRSLRDAQNNAVIDITYQADPALQGEIQLVHHSHAYQVTIRTLQHETRQIEAEIP